ncbi:MAG: helix-turn-helix domain-containing protein [Deferribacteraceae bacterium]|jgi:excisionase family DNA binding protein|nr:helix-turn-helix domain-containing protein [Deferribacteraceae bacterium]
MANDKLLPVHIVARRLSISRCTIYRLINAGILEAVNIGIGAHRQHRRITEVSVDKFLSKNNIEEN